MKSKAEEGGIMTEEQQSWMKTQLIMTRLRPLKRAKPPKNRLGKWCYWLSRHKWFDLVVMACIVLNTVVMAMQYFGQGETYTRYDPSGVSPLKRHASFDTPFEERSRSFIQHCELKSCRSDCFIRRSEQQNNCLVEFNCCVRNRIAKQIHRTGELHLVRYIPS